MLRIISFFLIIICFQVSGLYAQGNKTGGEISRKYINYLKKKSQKSGLLSTSSDSHGLGFIPSAIDRSKMKRVTRSGLRSSSSLFVSSYTVPSEYLPAIRDQGKKEDCWAYATYASLESNILKYYGKTLNLSEYQMAVTTNAYNDGNVAAGGNFEMATAFLARWAGPVAAISDDDEESYYSTVLYHSQNARFLTDPDSTVSTSTYDTKFVADVKQALLDYGPVAIAIYGDSSSSGAGWNDGKTALYNASGDQDHAVSIVGWDDNYSVDHFAIGNRPPKKGAFKVRNSWGDYNTEGGYFWLSYCDKTMGSAAVFNTVESTDNYKSIYDYTPYGETTAYWSYPDSNDKPIYLANVFTASEDDLIKGVSFYVDEPGTTTNVYIYTDLSSATSPQSGTENVFASTTSTYAGYYTLRNDTGVGVSSGTKFSVVIKQTPPSGELAYYGYEAAYNDAVNVSASEGESFEKSGDDGTWVNAYYIDSSNQDQTANVPIKAFTVPDEVPDDVSAVRNGSETSQIYYTVSSTTLSANWDEVSGASGYKYIVSSVTSEASPLYGWADTDDSAVTVTGLSLTSGTTYYFGVRAISGSGLESADTAWSAGQMSDSVSPAEVTVTADDYKVTEENTLGASWTASSDADSGLDHYEYIVSSGTKSVSAGLSGWQRTDVISYSGDSFSLTDGTTYYFGVKAVDKAGNESGVSWSDGQFYDPKYFTSPVFSSVHNSSGAYDISYSSSDIFYANWTVDDDYASPVSYYYYLVSSGTETMLAGGTVSDTSTYIAVSPDDSSELSSGKSYFIRLRAVPENSTLASSEDFPAVMYDTAAPSAVTVTAPDSFIQTENTVEADWTSSSDAGSGVDHYEFMVSSGSASAGDAIMDWVYSVGLSTSYYISGLTADATYYIGVRAVDKAGNDSAISWDGGQFYDGDYIYRPNLLSIYNSTGSYNVSYTSAPVFYANWELDGSRPQPEKYNYYLKISSSGATLLSGSIDDGSAVSLKINAASEQLEDGAAYYIQLELVPQNTSYSVNKSAAGVIYDASAPSAPSSLLRPTATEEDSSRTTSTSELYGSWQAAYDAHSGIKEYLYAVTSDSGSASYITDWKSSGADTGFSETGLSLVKGKTYYYGVRAVNGAGIVSETSWSGGQTVVSTSAPVAVSYVYDGTGGSDTDYSSDDSSLSASWPASDSENDSQYDISYAVAYSTAVSAASGSWLNVGKTYFHTFGSLELESGVKYYTLVRAYDNLSGLYSDSAVSDGIFIDTVTPVFSASSYPEVLYSSSPDISGTVSVSEVLADTPVVTAAYPVYGGSYEKELTVGSPVFSSGFPQYTFSGYTETYYTPGIATFTVSGTDLSGNYGTDVFYVTVGSSSVSAPGGSWDNVNVSFANGDGSKVYIPGEAVPEGTDSVGVVISTYAVSASSEEIASADSLSEDSENIGIYRDISAYDGSGAKIHSFNSDITLSIPYSSGGNGLVGDTGVSSRSLYMYYLNLTTGKWERLSDSTNNTGTGLVEGGTDHLSLYALRAFVNSGTSISPVVYPNPARLNETPGKVIFGNISSTVGSAELYIYNVAGELVRKIDSEYTGDSYLSLSWDGKTEKGAQAATGLYLYLVKTEANGKARGKFYIIW